MINLELPDYRPAVGMLGKSSDDRYIPPEIFPILDKERGRVLLRAAVPSSFDDLEGWIAGKKKGPDSWFILYLRIGPHSSLNKILNAYLPGVPPKDLIRVYSFPFQLDIALHRADPNVILEAKKLWFLKHGGLGYIGSGEVDRPKILH
jgi:hypothetical protein